MSSRPVFVTVRLSPENRAYLDPRDERRAQRMIHLFDGRVVEHSSEMAAS
jgi:hypothetical protein